MELFLMQHGKASSGEQDHPLIGFRNSGIACLGRLGSGWEIRWVITPDLAHQSSDLKGA